MGTGYTRNDTGNNIADGNVIDAADLDGEFDAIQAAFNASTGHTHDGTTGEGPQIDTAGIADDAVTPAKLDETGAYTIAGLTSTAAINVDNIGENTGAAGVTIDGVVLKDGGATVTADVNFGDGDKAIFGAGSDLQIYHDGSNSIIQDAGTGSLNIKSNGSFIDIQSDSTRINNAANNEIMATFVANGAVSLYYDNATKLATTSTGIDVTGLLQVNGGIRARGGVPGSLGVNNNGYAFSGNGGDTDSGMYSSADGQVEFYTNAVERLKIDSTGNIQIGAAALTGFRTFDIYNTGSTSTDGAVMRFITQQAGSTSTTSADIFKQKNGAFGITNYETDAAAYMAFSLGSSERMRIKSDGNVGIGETNPTYKTHIVGGTTVGQNYQLAIAPEDGGLGRDSAIRFASTFSNNWSGVDYGARYSGAISYGASGGTTEPRSWSMRFYTGDGSDNPTERMRIDHNGNVGIGTSSLDAKLHVHGSQLGGTAGDDSKLLQFYNPDVTNVTTYRFHNYRFTNGTSHSSSEMRLQRKVDITEQGYVGLRDAAVTFGYGTTEKMRIDSSGNLLVGKTSSASSTVGVEARNDGVLLATRANNLSGFFNRTSSDGEIVRFAKDDTTVGSIGVSASDDIYFAGGTGSTKGIYLNNNGLLPATTGGSASDGTVDIGESITRWKNLYLSGGVYLGGTGSANYLDDYEEGTFTPGFTYSIPGTFSCSFSEAYGYYTKVGNLVTCSIFLNFSAFSKGTASGVAHITGLPFTSKNVTRLQNVGGFSAYNYPKDTSKQTTFHVETNTSLGNLIDVGNNTTNDQINDPDPGTELKLSVSYLVN